jgi:hypothetical protein
MRQCARTWTTSGWRCAALRRSRTAPAPPPVRASSMRRAPFALQLPGMPACAVHAPRWLAPCQAEEAIKSAVEEFELQARKGSSRAHTGPGSKLATLAAASLGCIPPPGTHRRQRADLPPAAAREPLTPPRFWQARPEPLRAALGQPAPPLRSPDPRPRLLALCLAHPPQGYDLSAIVKAVDGSNTDR